MTVVFVLNVKYQRCITDYSVFCANIDLLVVDTAINFCRRGLSESEINYLKEVFSFTLVALKCMLSLYLFFYFLFIG